MPEIDEGLLLTEEELGLLEWESTTLDMSFMDDYPNEVNALLEAQLAKATLIIEKRQQEKDTAYYAEMMKKAIDRVRIEAKKQERESIYKSLCLKCQAVLDGIVKL